jgi:16S rRNA (uracil1498-N3)-methyltransferase
MAISRIFVETQLTAGQTLALEDAAATHIARVLRLREGEPLILFDGEGGEYAGVVSHIDRRGVTVAVGEHAAVERESPLHITLVQAMVSGDKLDWITQKAVEIGISAIQPIQCERSVARLQPEKEARRLEHMRRVAISACEQSGRNRLPAIAPPMGFAEWLAASPAEPPLRLMLHPEATQSLATININGPVEILIGPEGGFTEGERRLAQNRGVTQIRIGPRVLRTETAGLAVAAALQARAGDWC